MKTNYLHKISRKAEAGLCRLMPRPRTRFATVTGGRTGSHLLLSLLDSHPKLQQHGEVIGEARLRQPGIKATIVRRGAVGHIKACLSRTFISQSAVGFKLNYYQLENAYAAKWGVPDLPQVYNLVGRKIRSRIPAT